MTSNLKKAEGSRIRSRSSAAFFLTDFTFLRFSRMTSWRPLQSSLYHKNSKNNAWRGSQKGKKWDGADRKPTCNWYDHCHPHQACLSFHWAAPVLDKTTQVTRKPKAYKIIHENGSVSSYIDNQTGSSLDKQSTQNWDFERSGRWVTQLKAPQKEALVSGR